MGAQGHRRPAAAPGKHWLRTGLVARVFLHRVAAGRSGTDLVRLRERVARRAGRLAPRLGSAGDGDQLGAVGRGRACPRPDRRCSGSHHAGRGRRGAGTVAGHRPRPHRRCTAASRPGADRLPRDPQPRLFHQCGRGARRRRRRRRLGRSRSTDRPRCRRGAVGDDRPTARRASRQSWATPTDRPSIPPCH